MEQNLGHIQEDRFGVGGVGQSSFGVAGKVGDADETGAHGTDQGGNHPGDADAAAGGGVLG